MFQSAVCLEAFLNGEVQFGAHRSPDHNMRVIGALVPR
jgi:hypothetical protein